MLRPTPAIRDIHPRMGQRVEPTGPALSGCQRRMLPRGVTDRAGRGFLASRLPPARGAAVCSAFLSSMEGMSRPGQAMPERLGDRSVLRVLLGRGGMGMVRDGRDTTTVDAVGTSGANDKLTIAAPGLGAPVGVSAGPSSDTSVIRGHAGLPSAGPVGGTPVVNALPRQPDTPALSCGSLLPSGRISQQRAPGSLGRHGPVAVVLEWHGRALDNRLHGHVRAPADVGRRATLGPAVASPEASPRLIPPPARSQRRSSPVLGDRSLLSSGEIQRRTTRGLMDAHGIRHQDRLPVPAPSRPGLSSACVDDDTDVRTVEDFLAGRGLGNPSPLTGSRHPSARERPRPDARAEHQIVGPFGEPTIRGSSPYPTPARRSA